MHYICLCMPVQHLWSPEEGTGSPGAGVTDGYKQESNPGPLEVQPVLVTVEFPMYIIVSLKCPTINPSLPSAVNTYSLPMIGFFSL